MNTARTILILLLMILCADSALADASSTVDERRETISNALKKGVLTPYDIPFNTYASLGMWEPVDQILRRNFENTLTVQLPGKYYSRPLEMDDRIWVFENGNEKGGEIYLFSPDALKPEMVLKDDAFNLHASGVRVLYKNHIVSGGSNEDIDRVAVWNIESGKITLLTLSAGHYISALAVENGRLYAGACGGIVNVWQMDDLSPAGVYKAASEDISDWQVFNRQECIHQLFFFNDQLVGAGDRHLLFWDLESKKRIKKIKKIFAGGNICFFEGNLIEYKENRLAVRPLDHPDAVRFRKVRHPIDDLIVTREKVLPDQEGAVIALTARYNRGIFFYGLDSLDLTVSTELRGESLSQYKGALFATDDRRLYRHDIRGRDSENLDRFLKGLSLEKLPCTDDVYASLMKRGEKYPRAIDLNQLGQWFLDGHDLSLIQEMEKGKIGHQDSSEKNPGAEGESVAGHKLMYEIDNASETPYYIRLAFRWSVQEQKNGNELLSEPGFTVHHEDVIAPSFQGSGTGIVVLGETVPEDLWIYPERITPLPPEYYDQLMQALSPDNRNEDLIDKFLKDERVQRWHPELMLRKQEAAGSHSSGRNLYPMP